MFKSLLFLVFLSLVSSHWICNLEGGESCVTSPGDEMITEGFEGAWISHKTQVTVSNEINCAFACIRINCAFYIYPEESKCILAIPEEPKAPAQVGSARHFNLNKKTNVALGKTIYGSSVHSNPIFKKEKAIDGIVGEGNLLVFSVNIFDMDGWFVVDLETAYVIRAIRIFGRTDKFRDMRSTIYGGNELILDGNFGGKYTVLFNVEEERLSLNSHYVASFTNTKAYRYVAMKKNFEQDSLQVIEFEVYA